MYHSDTRACLSRPPFLEAVVQKVERSDSDRAYGTNNVCGIMAVAEYLVADDTSFIWLVPHPSTHSTKHHNRLTHLLLMFALSSASIRSAFRHIIWTPMAQGSYLYGGGSSFHRTKIIALLRILRYTQSNMLSMHRRRWLREARDSEIMSRQRLLHT